jgi:hypothetical protein
MALAAVSLFLLIQTHPPGSEAAACSVNQEQQPEAGQELIDRVAARLESASPVDRAWGAYLAQKNGLKQFTPNLIETLRMVAGDESPDAWLVTSAVLDSLIQQEADPRRLRAPAGNKDKPRQYAQQAFIDSVRDGTVRFH